MVHVLVRPSSAGKQRTKTKRELQQVMRCSAVRLTLNTSPQLGLASASRQHPQLLNVQLALLQPLAQTRNLALQRGGDRGGGGEGVMAVTDARMSCIAVQCLPSSLVLPMLGS